MRSGWDAPPQWEIPPRPPAISHLLPLWIALDSNREEQKRSSRAGSGDESLEGDRPMFPMSPLNLRSGGSGRDAFAGMEEVPKMSRLSDFFDSAHWMKKPPPPLLEFNCPHRYTFVDKNVSYRYDICFDCGLVRRELRGYPVIAPTYEYATERLRLHNERKAEG
jgi:hypothetical protein